MKTNDIKKLKLMANTLRQHVIKMVYEAGSGHPGGSLGMADVFTALYFNYANLRPKKPNWENRDRIVLSNGHICPVQYSAMAEAGFFPIKELLTFRKINSRLQGHPHNKSLPGIENSSGPLGQGLSIACGMALARNMDKKKYKIFCLMSDGEHDEGQTWEAILFAAKYNLKIIALIDRNNMQLSGFTEKIMPLEPLTRKYEAFGWKVIEINGNDIKQVLGALKEAEKISKPVAIICHTIMGKGVSFMENNYEWHGKAPNKEQTEWALTELQEQKIRIGIEND
jgi:transketolase